MPFKLKIENKFSSFIRNREEKAASSPSTSPMPPPNNQHHLPQKIPALMNVGNQNMQLACEVDDTDKKNLKLKCQPVNATVVSQSPSSDSSMTQNTDDSCEDEEVNDDEDDD